MSGNPLKKIEKEAKRGARKLDQKWSLSDNAAALGGGLLLGPLGALGGAMFDQQRQANKEMERQGRVNEQQAREALRQQQRAFNQANQKTPDILQLLLANRRRGMSGNRGTFLTGAGGLSGNSLSLGGNSLLGA